MDIAEIRRRNLKQYAKSIGGQARLAKEIRRSDAQVSHLIGKNPKRNIGAKQARSLEVTLDLKKYWLDQNRFEGQTIPEYSDISKRNLMLVRKFSVLPSKIREPLRKHIESLHAEFTKLAEKV